MTAAMAQRIHDLEVSLNKGNQNLENHFNEIQRQRRCIDLAVDQAAVAQDIVESLSEEIGDLKKENAKLKDTLRKHETKGVGSSFTPTGPPGVMA